MSLAIFFFKIAPRQTVGVFAWYSVKICVIYCVRFERWKLDKKANVHENWSIQTLFYSILNNSAKCHQNRFL